MPTIRISDATQDRINSMLKDVPLFSSWDYKINKALDVKQQYDSTDRIVAAILAGIPSGEFVNAWDIINSYKDLLNAIKELSNV